MSLLKSKQRDIISPRQLYAAG